MPSGPTGMRELDPAIRAVVAGEEAYVVGGAVRDELLRREVLDTDVACPDPVGAARLYADRVGGALFSLSERHGAWRVAFRDGRTVDFTPLPDGIEADLRTRDFTVNAIAVPVEGGDAVDPLGGQADLEARRLKAVSPTVFDDDPLRLLRAVRLEDELGFRLDAETEALLHRSADRVREPAGERILGELERLSPAGFRRLDELGLLAPLGGSAERLDDQPQPFLLVLVFGRELERLPISNELRRLERRVLGARRPEDESPRAIHRFRRATEPYALEALAYLGADELAPLVREARRTEPTEPLLRGDELGIEPGPEVGRLLARIAEERAAGTISTPAEALELVRRERGEE
jgi:tRNA nucleotidyltransferase/poly(A) polymerase